MKKITVTGLSVLLLGIGMLQTSCFGQFKLTTKVWEFNQSVMGDDIGGRFVKTLLFWAMNIIPVYGIASFVDVLVLNAIEFWTGSNPLAMNEGDLEMQIVKNGSNEYEITATKNKFVVKQIKGSGEGKESSLFYTPENLAWNVEVADESVMIAQYFKDSNTEEIKVKFFGASGTTYDVPFSHEGLAMIHKFKPEFEEVATID